MPHRRLIASLTFAAAVAAFAAPTENFQIDVTRISGRVSPLHAGLMTEEINHSYDGGLYGELLSNRSFQDPMSLASRLPPHWVLVQENTGAAVFAIDESTPYTADLTATLRLEVLAANPQGRAGIANDGFWGIPLQPATAYRVTLVAKGDADTSTPLSLSLESPDGATTFAQSTLDLQPGDWRRYETTLQTTADPKPTTQARLVISRTSPGKVWFAYTSLFAPTYKGRANGNRIDLMEKLAALRPKFLRFPGGNYLEGDMIATRFDWKKTLGDPSKRPGHMGPWEYRSSDGLGLLEFLHWCEDLNMEPVLGVFAGLALKGEFVAPGKDLQPFVDDALDEIEYITGDVSTTWGARRAADGHPAPFKLTYVEIGNEDWDEKSDYDGRFAQFYDAIKKKHPHLQLISTKPVKSRTPDVLDDHYYRSARAFYSDIHHYDRFPRNGPKIFVGEWATMEGSPTPNFNAALGDAAWMTGMERNADLIVMQAYAPLLANINPRAAQWGTNLIGYDALRSYGSPSYYAQVMFNARRGDEILATAPQIATGLFHSVTRDSQTGTLHVKVVNTQAHERAITLEITGATPTGEGTLVRMAARPDETNTLSEPEKIVPVETKLPGLAPRFEHTFPGYSITVLEIPTRGN